MRTPLTILMDALVIVGLAITAGVVAEFFGALASSAIGERVVDVAATLRLPLGMPVWKTPYAGVFRADAALTVALVFAGEWLLARVRRRLS